MKLSWLPYMIETENLTRKFGDLTAVDNLTLQVDKGEVFGFLGPNGAGTHHSQDALLFDIQDKRKSKDWRLSDWPPRNALKIRKIIGLVPDNVGLYESLTAYENLITTARFTGGLTPSGKKAMNTSSSCLDSGRREMLWRGHSQRE